MVCVCDAGGLGYRHERWLFAWFALVVIVITGPAVYGLFAPLVDGSLSGGGDVPALLYALAVIVLVFTLVLCGASSRGLSVVVMLLVCLAAV